MQEEISFRPYGYNKCDQALEVLRMCDDITSEEYKAIKAMLDSSDEENLAMAEIALWDKLEGITIKQKKS